MDKALRYLVIAWVVLAALSWVFGMGDVEVYLLTALAAVIAGVWLRRSRRTTQRR
jgi:uncharacterized membrane protein